MGLYRFPKQSVPMLDHLLHEEILLVSNPLIQFETIFLCPISRHLVKETWIQICVYTCIKSFKTINIL